MKNLIEDKYLECEKELKININLSVVDVMFIKGKMEAYMNILESLKDYNLITTPKSIKLSEIVGNLKLQIEEPENLIKIQFNRKINAIGFGEYDTDWQQNTWQSLVVFYKDLTIKNICIKLQDNIKWLYTLWIAGTIIEDDLECDE